MSDQENNDMEGEMEIGTIEQNDNEVLFDNDDDDDALKYATNRADTMIKESSKKKESEIDENENPPVEFIQEPKPPLRKKAKKAEPVEEPIEEVQNEPDDNAEDEEEEEEEEGDDMRVEDSDEEKSTKTITTAAASSDGNKSAIDQMEKGDPSLDLALYFEKKLHRIFFSAIDPKSDIVVKKVKENKKSKENQIKRVKALEAYKKSKNTWTEEDEKKKGDKSNPFSFKLTHRFGHQLPARAGAIAAGDKRTRMLLKQPMVDFHNLIVCTPIGRSNWVYIGPSGDWGTEGEFAPKSYSKANFRFVIDDEAFIGGKMFSNENRKCPQMLKYFTFADNMQQEVANQSWNNSACCLDAKNEAKNSILNIGISKMKDRMKRDKANEYRKEAAKKAQQQSKKKGKRDRDEDGESEALQKIETEIDDLPDEHFEKLIKEDPEEHRRFVNDCKNAFFFSCMAPLTKKKEGVKSQAFSRPIFRYPNEEEKGKYSTIEYKAPTPEMQEVYEKTGMVYDDSFEVYRIRTDKEIKEAFEKKDKFPFEVIPLEKRNFIANHTPMAVIYEVQLYEFVQKRWGFKNSKPLAVIVDLRLTGGGPPSEEEEDNEPFTFSSFNSR